MEATSGVLAAILAVFTSVGEWIATAVTTLTPMFFAEGALTFLGVLAVSGLAFSVIFLKSFRAVKQRCLIESALIAGNTL